MDLYLFKFIIILGIICFLISIYIIIKSLLLCINALMNYLNKNVIAEEMCKAIEDNNYFHCFKLLSHYPQYINIPRDHSGYTPFMVACAFGNTHLVKYMLKNGADITQKSNTNETAFHLALNNHIKNPYSKNASCIWELHQAGADVDEPNRNGLSPLQIAAMFGHTNLVKWLLQKNATLDVMPHPYFLARVYGYHDTAMFIQTWISLRDTIKGRLNENESS